ncbi:YciI family protein [Clostridium paraputrificum]|uniref:YciI family protein n=1 Tax=Clostridium paraputrificum TaxID=29363 RepID=UPI002FCDC7B1
MKYFIVEGMLKDSSLINDDIMKKHMAYTQKAMDKGLILMSGLKDDMSGGIFVMKAESIEEVEGDLSEEPFKVFGLQDYNVIEFSVHYFNQLPNEWFNK